MSLNATLKLLQNINSELTTMSATPAGDSLSHITEELKKIDERAQYAAAELERLKSQIDHANSAVTEANTALDTLRNDRLGLKNAAAEGTSKELREAESTLQYLRDTNAGDAKVGAQETKVAQLRKAADDAAKKQRIATYEFEHSDEYRAAQETIAKAKAELAREKAEQEKREAELEAVKSEAKKRRKELEDEQARAATATQKHALGLLKAAGEIHSAADAIGRAADDAANQTVDAAREVSRVIGDSLEPVTQFSRRAEDMLRALSNTAFMTGGLIDRTDKDGHVIGHDQIGGALNGAAVAETVKKLVQEFLQVRSDSSAAGIARLFDLQRRMQWLENWIREWGGEAGRTFSFEEFFRNPSGVQRRLTTQKTSAPSNKTTSLSTAASLGFLP